VSVHAHDHVARLTVGLADPERAAVRAALFFAVLVGYYHHHFGDDSTPDDLVTLLEAADAEARRTLAESPPAQVAPAYEPLLADAYDFGRRHPVSDCRFCYLVEVSTAIAERLAVPDRRPIPASRID
jgi:hypothetical protein